MLAADAGRAAGEGDILGGATEPHPLGAHVTEATSAGTMTVLKLPFLCYVVLWSVLLVIDGAISGVSGTFVVGFSEVVRLALATLGIATIFLWRRPIVFFMAVTAWWLPQLVNVKIARFDRALGIGIVEQEPWYVGHIGPNVTLYAGWDLPGGEVLKIGVNIVALGGLAAACVAIVVTYFSARLRRGNGKRKLGA